MNNDSDGPESIFGEVISTYTAIQAVSDGVLLPIGRIGPVPVYVTANCFQGAGLDNPLQRYGVVMEAIEALRKPDQEDDNYRKLRVLHKGKAADYDCIWAILDGQGLTLMFPEDY